jgi:putative transposase
MKPIYDTNNHSVFLLQYHLILVTKYRRQVIDDKICKRLKEIFKYIAGGVTLEVLKQYVESQGKKR